MRLLTRNMLSSNIKQLKNRFPLGIQVDKSVTREVDFNPDFLKNVFVKINWKALVDSAHAMGYEELPMEANVSILESEEYLKKFHHALLPSSRNPKFPQIP